MALRKISGPVAELTGPVDYNTLTTTGVYHQGAYRNAQDSTNGPRTAPGLLEVHAGAGMVYQRFTAYRDGGIYTRSYYDYADTWYPWRKLVTEFRESDTALIRTSAVSGNWAQWDTSTLPTWLTAIRNNEGITTPPGRYRLEVVGSSRLATYLNGSSVGGLEAGVYLYDGELALYDSRGNAQATITRLA